jgi:predicted phosphoribosyltransferase
MFRGYADRMISLTHPEPFGSVGRWYEDFKPVTDGEVLELLGATRAWSPTILAV